MEPILRTASDEAVWRREREGGGGKMEGSVQMGRVEKNKGKKTSMRWWGRREGMCVCVGGDQMNTNRGRGLEGEISGKEEGRE